MTIASKQTSQNQESSATCMIQQSDLGRIQNGSHYMFMTVAMRYDNSFQTDFTKSGIFSCRKFVVSCSQALIKSSQVAHLPQSLIAADGSSWADIDG